MTTTSTKPVSCLCGSVHLHINEISKAVNACHCNTCRKWGGSALMVINCGNDMTIESATDQLVIYNSSAWAQRGFCKQCGSHLFYQLKQSQQYMVPVGLFEEEDFVFQQQIFIDEKPDYYCFANDTKNMSGDEVIAEFES